MPVERTRVVGPVMLPDGSAAPDGAKIVFTLEDWDRQAGALIMHGQTEAVVIGGAIDKSLKRSSGERGSLYEVSYHYWNEATVKWAKLDLGQIALVGPGPVVLADLLALPAPIPNVPDVLTQALGAKAGADAAAGISEENAAVAVDKAAQASADALIATQQRALSEAAANAALNSNWTYIVGDNAALLALTGMTANQTAFVKATEHQWKYEGGVWVDKGPSVIAGKADAADVNAKLGAVGGFSGVYLTDEVGNAFGQIPGDTGGVLKLPHLTASSRRARLGPFEVELIDGMSGIFFGDEVGNIKVQPDSGPPFDANAALKIASPPNSVVTFGHSKTQQNSWGGTSNVGNPNGGTARKADEGWLAWLDYYLRGSITWLHNAGVGGDNDAQLLSRVQSAVISKNPAWCFVMGGTCNSIHAGRTSEEIIAAQLGAETVDSMGSILGALQKAGIRTMWLTDPTWYTGHVDLTAAKVAILNRVNRAMLRAQGYKDGLLAVDTAGAVVDPLSTAGAARQYYLQSDDNIHQSPLGARVMGKLAAQRLRESGFPLMDVLVASMADRYGASSASRQLIDNPLMLLGAGGTISQPTVISGQVPEGWTITRTGTWGSAFVTSELQPRADGYGNDWVVTVHNTGADGDQLSLVGPDCRARVGTGDILEAAAEVEITGMAKVKGHEFYVSLAANTPTSYGAISTLERDAAANWPHDFYDQSDITGGVMKTGKAAVPTGTMESHACAARLRMTFGGAGGKAVIRIARAQLLKNS